MLLLEINEFSSKLMAQAAEQLGAKNLKKLLSFRRTDTYTDDKEERFGLDPWVQWVSIHTGKTSSEHKVKHLADLSNMTHPQIWETLSQKNYRCGIWGAMNASLKGTKNIDFFIPDPWSFEQAAHPKSLQDLVSLPVYYAKNYGELSLKELLKNGLKLLRFMFRPRVFFTLLPILPKILKILLKNGFKNYLLFVLFDWVNICLFVSHHKKYRPDFSILFLNSLAHLQHHKWTSSTTLSHEMLVAFQIFDEALGVLFNYFQDGESIVATNAFTQVCSFEDREFLYRQINPSEFLKKVNIPFDSIEQLMTNDAHVFFDNVEEAHLALDIFKAASVNGESLFHVDYSDEFPTRLFFQVIFWQALPSDSLLNINGKSIKFFDEFECITQRSGSHIPKGDIFSSHMKFPDKILNHEIHTHILAEFGISKC